MFYPLITVALFAIGPRPVVATRIEKIATELAANFNNGKFVEASKDFNTEMRGLVTPAIMASIKKQMDSEVGAFQSVSRTSEAEQDGVRAVDLLLHYEHGPVVLHVTFDAEDKVAAVHFNQMKEPPPALLETTARKFFGYFIAERFDDASSDFNATLREQLPPDRLRTLLSQSTAIYGPYQALLEAQPRENEGFRIVDLKTRWGKMMVNVGVVFDDEWQIAGLHIAPSQE